MLAAVAAGGALALNDDARRGDSPGWSARAIESVRRVEFALLSRDRDADTPRSMG